ncbi:phage terminase small subunit [Bradyrhizobium japonicum]|uniref:P27 family phage terminase small subunit n=1 Tax=Bradyrhizobium japonicum TaxID=375 RepID=UPI002169446A|nr:P27 family phage terminase small subunit [Bradyrhizobium japonicum]MCS3503426.1 phage terminase small subunit [Bradyrhizobium japonicum]MCS3963855.1 phage terminase small subunit [Bradyrhizobium japonicum]MCS3996168.1 phage terminase small subunit [Bradyrhizobium japonicum]
MKHIIPKHLSAPTRRWIKQILADFDLESFHFRLLTKAGEAWDRSEQARELLAKEGITTPDRYGVAKTHPAIAIERDSRLAFARLLRELALDAAAPDSRPPRTPDYGNRR